MGVRSGALIFTKSRSQGCPNNDLNYHSDPVLVQCLDKGVFQESSVYPILCKPIPFYPCKILNFLTPSKSLPSLTAFPNPWYQFFSRKHHRYSI
ncbi:uncharacterized protein LOC119187144 isoform X2 [Rhipicephalus microplus]|uniref:uncharacterized protein LOC119187144 isoform X2 n=1 Tax=Rhipicephalus microplus TaxID=6941 RepID=UPI003F6B17FD